MGFLVEMQYLSNLGEFYCDVIYLMAFQALLGCVSKNKAQGLRDNI